MLQHSAPGNSQSRRSAGSAQQAQPWLAQLAGMPQFAAFVEQASALGRLHALVVEARVQMQQSMRRLAQCNTQQLAAFSAAAAPAAFDGASAAKDLSGHLLQHVGCLRNRLEGAGGDTGACVHCPLTLGVAGSRFWSPCLGGGCVCKPFKQVSLESVAAQPELPLVCACCPSHPGPPTWCIRCPTRRQQQGPV